MAVERKLIREHKKRVAVREFLHRETERAGFGGAEITRTPMGTRIHLVTERPGFVIGRRGETIKKLTTNLHDRFGLDNPQIEVAESERPTERANEISRWGMKEMSPLSLPDGRWDKMSYGIRDCEEFLRAIS